jgi:hypothetical protein
VRGLFPRARGGAASLLPGQACSRGKLAGAAPSRLAATSWPRSPLEGLRPHPPTQPPALPAPAQSARQLRLTRKASLLGAAGTLPSAVEDLKDGQVLPGYVASVTADGVFVRRAGSQRQAPGSPRGARPAQLTSSGRAVHPRGRLDAWTLMQPSAIARGLLGGLDRRLGTRNPKRQPPKPQPELTPSPAPQRCMQVPGRPDRPRWPAAAGRLPSGRPPPDLHGGAVGHRLRLQAGRGARPLCPQPAAQRVRRRHAGLAAGIALQVGRCCVCC